MTDLIGMAFVAFIMGGFVFFLLYFSKEDGEYQFSFRNFLTSETAFRLYLITSVVLMLPVYFFGAETAFSQILLLLSVFLVGFFLASNGTSLFIKHVYGAYLKETKGESDEKVEDESLDERIRNMKDKN